MAIEGRSKLLISELVFKELRVDKGILDQNYQSSSPPMTVPRI